MGLFNTISTPSWQGPTQAPTTKKKTLDWNPYQVQPGQPAQTNWQPMQVQPGQPLSLNWQPYDPKAIPSTYNFGQPTPYSGIESNAISQLSNIIQYGGYSPEQKQAMIQGAMAPVYQGAEEARQRTEADAYARGLGQSSVLSRGYADIDQSVLAALAGITGQIEQQGAGMIMPAIQAAQVGQQNLQQMMSAQAEAEAGRGMTREQLLTQLNIAGGELESGLVRTGAELDVARQQIAAQLNMTEGELMTSIAQMNAELALSRQKLSAELNMHEGDLQMALNQINATLEMSDLDRQMELQRIMNQFNLDGAKMEMLQNEAKKDRWSSFFSNLIGGGAEVLGGYLGRK